MSILDDRLNPGQPSFGGQRYVRIQAQDSSGSWVGACQVSMVSPGAIRDQMQQMKRQYPESRIRAIDDNGYIVDFLP